MIYLLIETEAPPLSSSSSYSYSCSSCSSQLVRPAAGLPADRRLLFSLAPEEEMVQKLRQKLGPPPCDPLPASVLTACPSSELRPRPSLHVSPALRHEENTGEGDSSSLMYSNAAECQDSSQLSSVHWECDSSSTQVFIACDSYMFFTLRKKVTEREFDTFIVDDVKTVSQASRPEDVWTRSC
ncbi:unnamed protein product [Pleuronectes platessa]|uniref:Uncharacterized protein n=1 Tax=Pleuronectes platessa TaxID=8262 RepID=A0A9N7VQY2_PLEPL|nr:unnamed protein product [Pleuronectes platessa]